MKPLMVGLVMLAATGLAFGPAASGGEKGAEQNPAQPVKSSLHSAHAFIGLEVVDLQGEQVGEIQDFLLELDNGRIAYAVISSGGVLGLGDSSHIVPWRAITPSPDASQVTLQLSKEKLAQAPKRKADMSDQEYHRGLHRFYGVSPNWKNQQADTEPPAKGLEKHRSIMDQEK